MYACVVVVILMFNDLSVMPIIAVGSLCGKTREVPDISYTLLFCLLTTQS